MAGASLHSSRAAPGPCMHRGVPGSNAEDALTPWKPERAQHLVILGAGAAGGRSGGGGGGGCSGNGRAMPMARLEEPESLERPLDGLVCCPTDGDGWCVYADTRAHPSSETTETLLSSDGAQRLQRAAVGDGRRRTSDGNALAAGSEAVLRLQACLHHVERVGCSRSHSSSTGPGREVREERVLPRRTEDTAQLFVGCTHD
mmetsp:Transcript_6219/g.13528  ORF Transcript_6219/g.13528 Transcript_6219/m.13528 type:complete len:201 (+) Transcript_6219:246-848(+)